MALRYLLLLVLALGACERATPSKPAPSTQPVPTTTSGEFTSRPFVVHLNLDKVARLAVNVEDVEGILERYYAAHPNPSAAEIETITVPTRDGPSVPLRDIAQIRIAPSTATLPAR